MKKKVKMGLKSLRTVFLILFDIVLIQCAAVLPLFIRFDFSFMDISAIYWEYIKDYAVINSVITILIFGFFKLYTTLWQYAAMEEMVNIVCAVCLSSVVNLVGIFVVEGRMPLSYIALYPVCLGVLVGGQRILYRCILLKVRQIGKKAEGVQKNSINTMIIGAGEAARALIREFRKSPETNNLIKCIIDDDRQKRGKYIQGYLIVGGRDKILESVEKYHIQEIVVAMPSVNRKEIRKILEICKETNCMMKILPGIYQLVNGEVEVSKLRAVQIEDLLGREQVKTNLNEIMGYITDKVVLITGGGGSIGSELCRQVATYKPKQLIIVDIYENNAYDIQQELIRKHPELNLVVLIASVRNTHRMESIFENYKPEVVYHAAAHKHVPLMENSPNEAIKNNVFGTYKTAMAAAKYGAKRFVMISTDKAVNPTNIMGASKRICEMIVQMFDRKYKTEFVAVRFGNVLGSNGSVIPLFKKQIEEGGPVTVTHPDIIRYFMTIPEAVSLVLQAGAYAKGGEIFVLDMGEPVKILDLAVNLIKLSGYVPYEDIDIQFTGLRPGEKLYEELLMKEEGLQETSNQLIHIGKPIEMDEQKFEKQLEQLQVFAYEDQAGIRKVVSEIVTTYQYQQ